LFGDTFTIRKAPAWEPVAPPQPSARSTVLSRSHSGIPAGSAVGAGVGGTNGASTHGTTFATADGAVLLDGSLGDGVTAPDPGKLDPIASAATTTAVTANPAIASASGLRVLFTVRRRSERRDRCEVSVR
jgi:hypothetical protein